MSVLMPFSPLDELLDALPALRKAGRVRVGDTVLSVQQRMADVLRPIVKKIEENAVQKYQEKEENA